MYESPTAIELSLSVKLPAYKKEEFVWQVVTVLRRKMKNAKKIFFFFHIVYSIATGKVWGLCLGQDGRCQSSVLLYLQRHSSPVNQQGYLRLPKPALQGSRIQQSPVRSMGKYQFQGIADWILLCMEKHLENEECFIGAKQRGRRNGLCYGNRRTFFLYETVCTYPVHTHLP